MTKIKHYDNITKEWVIDGASNASNLELTNPGYLDQNGDSISLDNGFTKIDNRISKLEQNLAWIYLNGAKGGSGSGGTGGDYFIDMQYQSDVIYTTSGNVSLTLLINSGNVSKTFLISVRGVNSQKIFIKDLPQRSLKKFTLNISGINKDEDLEITAIDNSGITIIPVYVKVIMGALYLDIQPNDTINTQVILGSSIKTFYTYKVTNKTQDTAFLYIYISNNKDPYINNESPIFQQEVKLTQQSFRVAIQDLLPKVIQVGEVYRIQAVAVQKSMQLKTDYKILNVTISAPDQLIISTPGIQDNLSFIQNNYAQIQCVFNYNKIDFREFGYQYSISNELGEILIKGEQLDQILPNKTFSLGFNITDWLEGNYTLTIKGFPANQPNYEDFSAVDTHAVKFKVVKSDTSILMARNFNNRLLAYFSNFTFPSNSKGTWTYIPETNPEKYLYYTGPFNQNSKINLFKVDGINSGFVKSGIPRIVLANSSYGSIDIFKTLFPQRIITESLFAEGFCLSCTFKAQESVDTSETILSFGRYEKDTLDSGFEITLEKARIKINKSSETNIELPQNQLLTIDLNVEPINIENKSEPYYFFTLYLNGVMSSCIKVAQSDIDWNFGKALYLGCREDLSHNSVCEIFDFKIYSISQSQVSIVQNYISATEQANLIDNKIDPTLDLKLRRANFFIGEQENTITKKGPCIIWNYAEDTFIEGESLYNNLLSRLNEGTLSYPIIYFQETLNTSNLKTNLNAVWSEGNKDILKEKYPVKAILHTPQGSCNIEKPTQVSNDLDGPCISIQGTSSLSYMSKNLEFYIGNQDEQNRLLLNVKDDWLPENEFTLKADVVDSGHVNNVAIGKILNDKNLALLTNTPPMDSGEIWRNEGGISAQQGDSIRSKIKHTSDGFPCLAFIKFSDGTTKFLGIYNFNLGRYAVYNLGLKLLLNFEKPDNINPGAPYLVTNYQNKTDAFNNQTYSFEIARHNNFKQEAFTQNDDNTVRWMADCRYTSTDEDTAYSKIEENFYGYLSKMIIGREPKYIRTDLTSNGVYKPTGEYWEGSDNYFSTAECNQYIQLQNAMTYYLVAMIFGMVDSTCKNMTLRSWGGKQWWLCFYDMDTAFKMNNAGEQVVKYDAHFHNYFNVDSTDSEGNYTGYTNAGDGETSIYQNYGIERFSPTGGKDKNHPEFVQYYASTWNRIWEVLELLPSKASNGNDLSLGKIYWKIRRNIIKDPKEFINKYYREYVEQCGPILYNYDYSIKYLTIAKKRINGHLVDDSESKQESFLHGTRAEAVSDWFIKRIYFMDSIYNGDRDTIDLDIQTPLNNIWNSNKAGTGNIDLSSTAIAKISSKSKIKLGTKLGNDKEINYIWSNEDLKEIKLKVPLGQQLVNIYSNNYITKFDNFKAYNWSNLDTVDLPELTELDLSNLILLNNLFGVNGEAFNGVIGLKNIKKLILNNLKIISEGVKTLDVSQCSRLEYLDMSNSSYTNFKLPLSGSIKYLNLSNTNINHLGNSIKPFENQTSLEEINLSGCIDLIEVNIINCPSIKVLKVPNSVRTLSIINCESLEEIDCNYSQFLESPLEEVYISNCPNLKKVDLTSQNNKSLSVSILDCNKIETLMFSRSSIISSKLILPDINKWSSLKYLDISNTNIYYFKYINNKSIDYLDLKYFADLSYLNCSNCQQLVIVKCNNLESNPIELQTFSFQSCFNLQTLLGNFVIMGEGVFENCYNLKLNLDPSKTNFNPNGVNINFNNNLISTYSMFQNCNSLTMNDFKYIMAKLPNSLDSIENMFLGCTNIDGNVYRKMFSKCPNLTNLKSAFENTRLQGTLYSRTAQYNLENSDTWGVFDFIKHASILERCFSGTSIQYLDENLFDPILETVTNIDGCFQNCINLHSIEDSNNEKKISSKFSSKTYFTKFKKLYNNLGWPSNVFNNCLYIDMQVDQELIAGSKITYLFHTNKNNLQLNEINKSLYSGIHLFGELGPNTFGGITSDLKNYSIPRINSIDSPFIECVGNDLFIDLQHSENLFQNQNDLRRLSRVFANVKCEEGTDIIPDNLFKNCFKLLSISELFHNMQITNAGNIYEFPNNLLFKDCTSLRNISKLFLNQNHLKIKLLGEGFKNCKLENVSEAFKNSGLFGIIPYRLWYMYDQQIIKTINNISNVFNGCFCLGYDETRIIDEETELYPGYKITWEQGIAKIEGNHLNYTMQQPNYTDDEIIWQMDGRPWKQNDIPSESWLDWHSKYFKYDEQHQEAVKVSTEKTVYIEPTSQNYIIPCDYFRYCSDQCNLEYALKGINRVKRTLKMNDKGQYEIKNSEEYEGLLGRLPCKLFEGLPNIKHLDRVFADVYIYAYITQKFNADIIPVRGLKFPLDLLTYNTKLISIQGLFQGFKFEVGVDINPNLFETNTLLADISNLFSDCSFSTDKAKGITAKDAPINQIPCIVLFSKNSALQNISNVFSGNIYTKTGPLLMDRSIFEKHKELTNISYAFYACSNMKGTVPVLKQTNVLTNVENYLELCNKDYIENANEEGLKWLWPESWKEQQIKN